MSHFVGARVPDVPDAGGKHEDGDDEPAPKMQTVYRSFQKALWLLLLPWLFVVANDSAVACYRAGIGCSGCADCSKMFCVLYLSRSAGPCENSSCNPSKDGGYNRFRLAAARDHRDLYHRGNLDRTRKTSEATMTRTRTRTRTT